MSVISPENKEMLLELMISISNDNRYNVNNDTLSEFIYEKCAFFHSHRFEYKDINEINKKIIDLTYNYVLSTQTKSPPVVNKTKNAETFESRQTEFKQMINPKKPKDIDFSDKNEDMPIQNINRIMSQTLADREKELANITQKYTKTDSSETQKWLNRENDGAPKLKIEEISNVKMKPILLKSSKRVSFKEDEKPNSVMSLFSKLKTKEKDKEKDIIGEIISNQKKILLNQDKLLKLLSIKNRDD